MQHNEIDRLIGLFAELPTIGKKTASRIVLELLAKKKPLMHKLSEGLEQAAQAVKTCEICHNLDVTSPCGICSSEKRQKNIICIVENIEDLFAIEQGQNYNGTYHVLGGALSAVKGISPEDLNLDSLEKRINNEQIDELIIAVSASMEGQTTSFFLADLFKDKVKQISKLGYGLPLGGEIGYLDEGTINAAFEARKEF